jgi:hypothetical protein
VGRGGDIASMSEALKQALQLLGFGTPILYAAATYGFFHWLDKRASGQAKNAISEWIKTSNYDERRVVSGMVEVFDTIYTYPLLRLQPFIRVVIASLILHVSIIAILDPIIFTVLTMAPEFRLQILLQLVSNIVSDYFSLFLIRHWLLMSAVRPIFALMTGPVIGLAVIMAVYLVTDVGLFSIQTSTFSVRYFLDDIIQWWTQVLPNPAGTRRLVLLAALAIHLWLPLLALGMLTIKVLTSFVRAVRTMQWFIKRGRDHPLDAIGMVAAVIMFVATLVLRIVF